MLQQIKQFYSTISSQMRERCQKKRLHFAGVDRLMDPPCNQRYKHAGVLIIYLVEQETVKVVFIRRSADGGVHSGQVAFPGGGFDRRKDRNLLQTALRETYEEIGLKVNPEEVVCNLTPLYVPPSRYMVHPYLAVIESNQQFHIDMNEVTEVYQISIHELLEAPVVRRNFKTIYGEVEANCYQVRNLYIWGATAIILSELLCLEKYRLGMDCHP